ncbi:FAD-binding protein [Mycolicibacterium sp. 120270]|uniref:FAD-binding protein n=1 Tax=Mycolicibacterium sp. 120270 TaxID=3090600 RepID=UPI00299DF203|nr:FAD-binding protein [Mycolicibacterium sp. 120270]MDX1887445.1 FAD-binding protein [Mycolicibacterium sp. 120270]
MGSDLDVSVQECDVLVVGGGIGGVRAALRAAELGSSVILVEKAVVSRAGPMTYVHSQYAPDHRVQGEEMTEWAREFVVGSNYLADQDWVQQYIAEAYDRVNEQIEWGVPYSTQKDGSLKYVTVRGHNLGTTLGVDGRVCMEILKERMKAAGVRLFERVDVIDLLTTDGCRPTAGAVCGAVGVNVVTGQCHVFTAGSVILNTGPWYPKLHYAFADHCSGEGHVAAWRVGAEFAGMEFGQFAAWSYFNRSFFTPGQAKIQGIGGKFCNVAGEYFMDRYDPIWGDKGGLFTIARAIMTEMVEGRGPCYLDLRHVPQADLEVLYEVSPTVRRAFTEFEVDPSTDLLEVTPFIVLGTSSTSGPTIDLDGATTVPGLYAAGYGTACPHLMSGISGSGISSFSAVAGYRAGTAAAARGGHAVARSVWENQAQESFAEYFAPMRRLRQVRPVDVWKAIGEATANPAFALFKSEARIDSALAELYRIRDRVLRYVFAPDYQELKKAHEVRAYLTLAIITCEAMKRRTESRGELFRIDYPYADNDEWLKWLLVRRGSGGEFDLRFSERDLPIQSWPVQAPPGRHPSPYTVPQGYREEAAVQ